MRRSLRPSARPSASSPPTAAGGRGRAKESGKAEQGRLKREAQNILNDVTALEQAGAYAVVLELIPTPLAKMVTGRISIPTIGIGSGQTSRIDSTKIALSKIPKKFTKVGFVAASDAFFPFTDNIKLLIKNNCKSIIQAKGSINDSKIINYANKYNFPLYL